MRIPASPASTSRIDQTEAAAVSAAASCYPETKLKKAKIGLKYTKNYEKIFDYMPYGSIIKRWKNILPPLYAVNTGGGAVDPTAPEGVPLPDAG